MICHVTAVIFMRFVAHVPTDILPKTKRGQKRPQSLLSKTTKDRGVRADHQLSCSNTMSSEGPYGRQGFQSNPSGYGSYGGGYSQPQYGQGYGAAPPGGASYAAPSAQAGSYGGGYGQPPAAAGYGDYQVCFLLLGVGICQMCIAMREKGHERMGLRQDKSLVFFSPLARIWIPFLEHYCDLICTEFLVEGILCRK